MNDVTSLLFKNLLLSDQEVSRVQSADRSISLFLQGSPADSMFFIEEGLVKLTRADPARGRFILCICGPNQLVGEEALGGDGYRYFTEAETLNACTVFKIRRETVKRIQDSHPELSDLLTNYLVQTKLTHALKVEMLCLHDVESRVLYYLAELCKLVKPTADGSGYQIPITQSDLADLIGATRETTSAILNNFEKRNLLKLSRRLLSVSSISALRQASRTKSASAGDV